MPGGSDLFYLLDFSLLRTATGIFNKVENLDQERILSPSTSEGDLPTFFLNFHTAVFYFHFANKDVIYISTVFSIYLSVICKSQSNHSQIFRNTNIHWY